MAQKKSKVAKTDNGQPQELRKLPPLLQPLKTVEDADMWLQAYLKVVLPHVAVCPNHYSPLEVFWLIYSEKVEDALIIANRGGGKTTLLAAYATCYLLTHKESEICVIAGEKGQAYILMNYIRGNFLPTLHTLFPAIINSRTVRESAEQIVFPNKSVIYVRAATLKGTNAPHPHKVIFDEVETFDDWTIIQEALNMAITDERKGYKGQNIFASSRKFRFGIVQKLLDQAEVMGLTVLPWCLFETLAPSRCQYPDCSQCELRRADGVAFKDICQGKARYSAGFLSLDHVLSEFRRLDPQVFDAQWLGLKPSPIGLVFPHFNEAAHTVDGWQPLAGAPTYAGMDFGFQDPTVLLIAQVIGEKVIVIKERVWRNKPITDLIPELKMLRDQYNIRAIWCDPSRPDLTTILNEVGLTAYSAPRVPKEQRVEAIRAKLRLDDPLLLIDRSCTTLIEQMKSYHYEVDKRRGEPTDKLSDGNDDAIDALSYLIAGLLQGEIVYTNLYPTQEEILRWRQQQLEQQKGDQPDPVSEFLKDRLRTLRNPPPSFPNLPPFFPPLPPVW
jgi:hypothetical protein